jgi:hypothetical protein
MVAPAAAPLYTPPFTNTTHQSWLTHPQQNKKASREDKPIHGVEHEDAGTIYRKKSDLTKQQIAECKVIFHTPVNILEGAQTSGAQPGSG